VLLEQIVLAQSAFKLDAMNKRVTAATSVHEGLLYQTAKLSSPGRIERYARTKLGMIDPPAINYIVANVSPRRASNRRGLASAPGAATPGQAAPIVPPDGTP
jgi:hypothetical protein